MGTTVLFKGVLSQVDFQVDDITIRLFCDSSRQMPLSHLQLFRMTSHLSMFNDQSMKVDVSFGELMLEDLRASSAGGITKLIRNKFETKGKFTILHEFDTDNSYFNDF